MSKTFSSSAIRVRMRAGLDCLRTGAVPKSSEKFPFTPREIAKASASDPGLARDMYSYLGNFAMSQGKYLQAEKELKTAHNFAQDFSTHDRFRLFLSSDFSNAIPIGLLNRCIKITNEPPRGLRANLMRTFQDIKVGLRPAYCSLPPVLRLSCICHQLCLEFNICLLERCHLILHL